MVGSVCKWFPHELCKTHSFVLQLCCWGETQPCTRAASPAYELPNIQPYELPFNSLICPCPAVRVSAWPVLEEEMDRKHSFSEIIPIFFATIAQGSTESEHFLWVLPREVTLLSSRCCKNVLKMLSGDISAHFIFVIPRKQNLSTRRLTDLRNSIVTGLWCSKTQTKTQQPGGPLAFMLFSDWFCLTKERDCPPGLALQVFLMCVFFLATNGRFLWQHKTKTLPCFSYHECSPIPTSGGYPD